MTYIYDQFVAQYLFLHNLSAWHYSAIRRFAEHWAAAPSPLSREERTQLDAWAMAECAVFGKDGDFLVERYFAGSLSGEDQRRMRAAFAVFADRFHYHEAQQRANIDALTRYLEQLDLTPHLRATEQFYGKPCERSTVCITLSHNANHQAGGMAFSSAVVLQFGDFALSPDANEPIVSVLMHELTHDLPLPTVTETTAIPLPAGFSGTGHEYLEELIQQTLWSEFGVLSQQLFHLTDEEIQLRYEHLLQTQSEPLRSITHDAYAVRDITAQIIEEERAITPADHPYYAARL